MPDHTVAVTRDLRYMVMHHTVMHHTVVHNALVHNMDQRLRVSSLGRHTQAVLVPAA